MSAAPIPDLMTRVQAVASQNQHAPAAPVPDLMTRIQAVAANPEGTGKQPPPTESQDPRAGLGKGFLQGVGQTVGSVSGLINKIPGIGETLAPKQGVQALESMSTPQTTAEHVGSGLESIGEFVLGDEALQGLSLAKKLGIAQKVAKMAEEYPTLAKALHIGMNSLRQGAVGAGEGLAKGQSPGEAATTGAEVAGGSAVLGAASEAAGPLVKKAGEGVKNALSTISPESVQPEVQGTIRNAVGNTATKSIAKTVEDAADKVYGESKAQYKVLDEATGGRIQRFQERLKANRMALRNLTGTEADEVQEAKLLKAQKETEDAMQEAFEDAKKKGVDPKLVDEASANFKKSQALYDVDNAVKKSTTGMRPDIGDAKAAAKNPEVTDPEKFFKRINDLHRSGRLQEALGEKGADELLSKANEGVVKYRGVLRNQKAAKTVGKAAGVGLGIGGASKLVGHLMD